MEKNLLKAYLLAFSIAFFFFIAWFFFPLWFNKVGFSGLQIGIAFAVFNSTLLFLLFPVGIINDRVTVKHTMAVGFFIMSLALLFLSASDSFIHILLLFFLLGVGYSLSLNSIINFFFKTKSGKEGSKYGSYWGIRALGLAFGTFLGGFLIFFLDFSITFRLMGVLFFLLCLIALSLKDMPVFTFSVKKYKEDFFRKEVFVFAVILFLWASHWGAEATSYFLFLANSLKLNPIQIGLYAATAILFLGISSFWAGKKTDAGMDFRFLFFAGVFLSGIGHIAMTYPLLTSSIFFRIIHEIGDGLALFGLFFWTAKLFPVERIGGNAMLVLTIAVVGEMSGSIIYGIVGASFGYAWPLIISGIISLIIASIFLFIKKWY